MDRYMQPKELARHLGVSPRTVVNWIHSGAIRPENVVDNRPSPDAPRTPGTRYWVNVTGEFGLR